MSQNKKVLAIIPARVGSKGLPGKNIRKINGKPLIAHTIEAAVASGKFDKIVVSTDGKDIGLIASEYGAEVPFLRPSELASDETKTIEVVEHCIDFYAKRGECYDLICLLQATSPLRNANHIREAFDLLEGSDTESLVSVVECKHSPLMTFGVDSNAKINQFLDRAYINHMRRQEAPVFYRLNGAIYIVEFNTLMKYKKFVYEGSLAYVMNDKDSIDIDNIDDFLYAEYLMLTNG